MRFIYLFLACAIALTACTNTTNKATSVDDTLNRSEPASEKLPVSTLNDNGTQTLLALVNKYYDVKNALVASNVQVADSAAQQLVIVADSMKAFLQNDKAHAQLAPYADTIAINAKIMTTLKSKDVIAQEQQLPFSKISDAFYTLLQKLQLKNAHIYLQHCPMALNEKGANWVSDEEEIKNPYYGKKMIECGDITDSLK